MTDIFSTPDDTDELHASDLHTSLGEQLGAEAKNALDPSTWLSGVGIGRAVRAGIAGGNLPHDWDGLPGAAGLQLKDIEDQARAQIPSVSIDDARQRVNEAGLEGHVHLPEQGEIKSPVLDLMIQEGHERSGILSRRSGHGDIDRRRHDRPGQHCGLLAARGR
jgi:hypothetical protein